LRRHLFDDGVWHLGTSPRCAGATDAINQFPSRSGEANQTKII
jgi:hypothetical protein